MQAGLSLLRGGGAGVAYVFPNVLPTVAAAAVCIIMVLLFESKPSANNA
jgi:hypothetical protein